MVNRTPSSVAPPKQQREATPSDDTLSKQQTAQGVNCNEMLWPSKWGPQPTSGATQTGRASAFLVVAASHRAQFLTWPRLLYRFLCYKCEHSPTPRGTRASVTGDLPARSDFGIWKLL
jgi:hypothetical protein